jgi:protein ImuA
VRDGRAAGENGIPYGPGLAAIGLDPERALFVLAPDATTTLSSMEQALGSGTLGAVVGELRGGKNLDLTATRRLARAALRGGTPALLLRLGESKKLLAAPAAALTRWRVAALASEPQPANGVGSPRFSAELVRNRRGPTASFFLEWRPHECLFLPLPALCERVAPAALDRPDCAQVRG